MVFVDFFYGSANCYAPSGALIFFLIGKNIKEVVYAELMSKIIKIYGERNTGTNYFHHLINLNLDVSLLRGVVPTYVWIFSDASLKAFPSFCKNYRVNEKILDIYFKMTSSKNFGWKHTLISPELKNILRKSGDNVIFLTLIKNPYSWLLSLYDHPYHFNKKQMDFEQFLLKPWDTVGRENSSEHFVNPIDMWNKKNENYIELKDIVTIINIKYEDLLANPGNIIDSISKQFNIPKKYDNFKNLKQSVKRSEKDFNYYQTYYLKERWRDKLSNKSIKIINKYLNENLMDYFGYKKIEI